MKDKILDNIITKISISNKYNDTKLKEIRYGLESFYLSVSKLIVISIIAILINVINELLLLILFYGLLRLTAFGVHAKKSIHCWIGSATIFLLVPLIIKYVAIPKIIMLLVSLIFLYIYYKYAPADTEKRPLIHKKKRELYNYLSILLILIYILIITYTNDNYISRLLFFSIITEGVLIHPLTYKLLGVKYNNYLLYKRKENIE